jgi:hypothetical protein
MFSILKFATFAVFKGRAQIFLRNANLAIACMTHVLSFKFLKYLHLQYSATM